MKISACQNRIELDNGMVLISKDKMEMSCTGCFFDVAGSPCGSWLNIPCWTPERKDGGNKIFIVEVTK